MVFPKMGGCIIQGQGKAGLRARGADLHGNEHQNLEKKVSQHRQEEVVYGEGKKETEEGGKTCSRSSLSHRALRRLMQEDLHAVDCVW